MQPLLNILGLSTWKTRCIESYIAFLTWSFTYLFIRRALNPDTTKDVFIKFSGDAIFGGLAAAAAILLKHALKEALIY